MGEDWTLEMILSIDKIDLLIKIMYFLHAIETELSLRVFLGAIIFRYLQKKLKGFPK